ncbi:hypothetical protein J2S74_005394 [Evansella vedderi]|uniref:Uncharacterized protein n=1 Tax=Evansella vedderi TaxID=38282 RepID=A0ABU0A367_9BACI|nr:hypothetical protein [Evansella vedderi]MDQ0257931.1 hypothetical protein [Evansella vedderi]
MSHNRAIKPVSFSLNKDDEVEMLDYVKNKNFSNYVKRLIFFDMRQKLREIEPAPTLPPVTKDDFEGFI